MAVRILIADDHEQVRSAISLLIRDAGWEVCGCVGNGKAAIEKAAELNPDVLVLDCLMPDRDGLSVGRDVRRFLPSLPIVLCTVFRSPYIEDEAKKCGFQGVVQKANGRALISGIRNAIAS